MREPDRIAETLKHLKQAGYHIIGKVVAVHQRSSITGILLRYEEQKAAKGFGRWTHIESHDAGYEGMPKTVEHIERKNLADRLAVFRRDGGLIFSNSLEGNAWKRRESAVNVIETERLREPTDREIDELHSDWKRIFSLMEQRKATPEEISKASQIYEMIQRGM